MDTYSRSRNMGDTMITQTGYGRKEDPEEIHIKNLKGELGPICNYCAGLGFTNTIGGMALSCRKCEGSGIEPVNSRDLQKQIDELKQMITKLAKKIK